MKKTFLTMCCAAALLMGTSTSWAQEADMPPPPPPHHPEHVIDAPRPHIPPHELRRHKGPKFDKEFRKEMSERFADKLGLTDEQKAQAEKLREANRAKMEPLMKQADELRGKMDEIRKQNMDDFEKILTPEQKQKLDEMKAKREAKMQKRMEKRAEKMKEWKKDKKDKKVDD